MLALLALSSLVATIVTVPTRGSAQCPCVKNISSPRWALDPIPAERFSAAEPNVDFSIYGQGCAPHDANTLACLPYPPAPPGSACDNVVPLPPECDATSEKSWCTQSWCYVSESCSTAFEPSTKLAGRYFSYSSCGELDSYTQVESYLEDALRGVVLRVRYLNNTGGYSGSYHPDTKDYHDSSGTDHRDSLWYGPYPDLMQYLAQRAGFIINITSLEDVPDFVLAKAAALSTSQFTQCVFLVGLGYIDVCVGDFTVNSERQQLNHFFSTRHEPYYLILDLRDGSSVAEHIATVFKPFEPTLWALLTLAVALAAALLVWQERGLANGDFETGTWLEQLGRTSWLGLRGLLGGGMVHQGGQSVGGRVTSIGLTFFLFLVGSSYTASLTTFLVTSVATSKINDINDAINAGLTMCSSSTVVPLLKKSYPKIKLTLTSINASRFEAFASLAAGECAAIVAPVEDLEKFQGLQTPQFCSYATRGLPCLVVPKGFPFFKTILAPLSYYAQTAVDGNKWNEMVTAAKPESGCEAVQTDSLSLDVSNLLGSFLILVLFTSLGFLISVVSNRWARASGHRKGAVPSPTAATITAMSVATKRELPPPADVTSGWA